MCEWRSFDGGWPSIFYISGVLGLLFCIPVMLLVFDSPADHPRISEEELKYIEANISHQHGHRKVIQIVSESILDSSHNALLCYPAMSIPQCITLYFLDQSVNDSVKFFGSVFLKIYF